METTAPPRLGKYDLRGELGRGAMGVVYRAWDRVLEREVALKTMAGHGIGNAQTVRFLREARTAGALHHPNIVTIHELGQDSGTYFIAMELLRGRSLYEALQEGQLPPLATRLEYVARICDGLDYAHRAGIVHRDIKPANVFLLSSGTVKILDFGIAKIAKSEATRTGLVIGTVDYMSPEQVRAAKDLDGRADIFSAGVILYELIFGRRPFAADDIGAALHRILHEQPPGYALYDRILTPELADVLRRCLDKRREARFTRAGEMAAALDGIAATLHGRAGTELAERIAEVCSSGLLERREPEPELPCPDGETREIDSLPPRSGDSSERSAPIEPRRTRGRWIVAALFTAAALLAGWLLRQESGSGPEPASIAVDAPAPPREEPSDAGAATETAEMPVDEDASGGETDPVTLPRAATVAAAPPETIVAPTVSNTDTVKRGITAGTAPDPGFLELRVTPWADVAWIENIDSGERIPGDATSPARLQLPAGRYRLRLSNPYAGSAIEVDAELRGGETALVQRTLPGFDAGKLAADLLASDRPEGAKR